MAKSDLRCIFGRVPIQTTRHCHSDIDGTMAQTPTELSKEAEKSLDILKTNYEDLEKEVSETEKSENLEVADVEQRALLFSERVTQDLLALDGVAISKSKGAEAYKAGDRKVAMKISVLLTRRKTLVRNFNALGERIDKLTDAKPAEE